MTSKIYSNKKISVIQQGNEFKFTSQSFLYFMIINDFFLQYYLNITLFII